MENKSQKERFDTDERVISMKVSELNDLVFYACRRAVKHGLDGHFKGLLPFLNLQHDLQQEVLKELEQVKLRLDSKE